MQRYQATALLCSLLLIPAVASAAERKPRKMGGRVPEVVVALTPVGTMLEAEYAARLTALRQEILAAIPTIDDSKKAAMIATLMAEAGADKTLVGAHRALRAARSKEDALLSLDEKLRIAPGRVAEAQQKLDQALALPDSQPDKAKIVDSSRADLAKRHSDLEKLPGQVEKARAELQKARAQEVELLAKLAAAMKQSQQTKAVTRNALDAMGLGALLASDKLDAKLVECVILTQATPCSLAQFAQQGPEKKRLLDQLFSSTPLMLQMLVADGPIWEKYGEAMEIYQAIQAASPRAGEGVLQRLAVAVSLQHAAPMIASKSRTSEAAPGIIDPVKRYLSYEKPYLDGELDPVFKDLTTWDLTMVVDGDEPDETLAWGRQMMRSYRPDLMTRGFHERRYAQIVDADIQYTSGYVSEDRPELENMQNIFANGGICGRRAFFGRFILRAFGIPAIERPEPGHATLAHWAPEGWQTYLGGAWGGGFRIPRYGKDVYFLVNTQARGDTAAFMKVKRAQWIGDLMGEPMVFGIQEREAPRFWYAVSIIEQDRATEAVKARLAAGASKPELALAPVQATESERQITIDSSGVITIPAVATKVPAENVAVPGWGPMQVVTFTKSSLGGMQLNYSRYGGPQVLEYTFDAPKAGRYQLTSRVITSRWDTSLLVSSNGNEPVVMPLPFTVGLWKTTEPIVIELKAGSNTLAFARALDMRKGISIRDFKLEPVN